VRRRKRVARALLLGVMTAGAGVALLRFVASDDLPKSAPTSLLDSIMPVYDVQEVHTTRVKAPPAKTYAAIFAVTPGEVALARPLLWVRALPARVSGKSVDAELWTRPLVSMRGTAILADAPGRELVVGLIGQFWKLRGGERVAVESREQFLAFDRSGFAVSTLSFHVEPDGAGARVTTITRVRTTDPESRRSFLRYWRVIGTGSALLRRTWLRAVKVRAEGP
jgi:hypothetical protein